MAWAEPSSSQSSYSVALTQEEELCEGHVGEADEASSFRVGFARVAIWQKVVFAVAASMLLLASLQLGGVIDSGGHGGRVRWHIGHSVSKLWGSDGSPDWSDESSEWSDDQYDESSEWSDDSPVWSDDQYDDGSEWSEPSSPESSGLPTLFCWMVVQRDNYELPLVKEQHAHNAGIFCCDSALLISDGDVGIPEATTLTIGMLAVEGDTKDGSTPNTPVFIEAWHAIKAHGGYEGYDWVVKADPDAVLVPARLQRKLASPPDNIYPVPYETEPGIKMVTNCDMANTRYGKSWDEGWPRMYGSAEIISRAAAQSFLEYIEQCKEWNDQWRLSGEDIFLFKCLRNLHADEIFIKQRDSGCDLDNAGDDCSDATVEVYHPKKESALWMQCWNDAMASEQGFM